MRERNRRQMARIKSRRASASELREAKIRLKELRGEFNAIPLKEETKKGETREERYARTLKLRTMREQFEAAHPYDKRPHANSLLLSLVMVISAFLLCGCFVGGIYAAYRVSTTKPDPTTTANGFWADMKTQQYDDLYSNFLSASVKAQKKLADFSTEAKQADTAFGIVTDAKLTKADTGASSSSLTYQVTRVSKDTGKKSTYDATITLQTVNNGWTVADLGAAVDPSAALGTSTTPTAGPTATPKKK